MCLAIPMELTAVKGEAGTVRMGGAEKEIRLDLVEDPKTGDYVIVHAGFAIQKLDKEQAEKDLALIERLLDSEVEGGA
ncbi:MAG: HypC/HybG/HupF family hydrogenase formation chaperone [Elusimicrobiota bacterium]